MPTKMTFAASVAATLAAATALQAESHGAPSACEGGYSVTDVDGNGYISPIEMDDYAKRQAAEMDSDGSGTVSRDEFINCANMMAGKKAAGEARTEEDMAAMDGDGDGALSAEEYMSTSRSEAESALAGDDAALARMNRLIFVPDGMSADTETMSLEEFASRAAMLFVALDSDQSADLTREEFMAMAPPVMDISEVLNREFDSADADGSGDLTETELTALNQRRAEEAAARAEAATGEEVDPEVGAPVVYYTYPSTM
jgi:Ca2+-binding EF-hand superfamily protein